jgi:phosphonate degradation associated HDIG domain protein
MDCVEQIFELFDGRGDAEYFGEAVSQKEHALQVAHYAAQAGASEALIVAALLHDVGHLLAGTEEMAESGIDGHHEAAGCLWLKEHFGPEVTEPVRMHVEAKRYLCYADPEYLSTLSPASVLSLQLQGGAFDQKEAQRFHDQPYAPDAVQLRRWDDQGKIPEFEVPDLEHYRAMLVSQAARQSSRCI